MSSTWAQRKSQLNDLLRCDGDDEEEGLALDILMHGQETIGKTQRSRGIENARFSDKDLQSLGSLAVGQFGTIELVNCHFDGRVYVRKRVAKKLALKSREQFSPQTERHILLLALKAKSVWAPRILCAYQCSTNLNILMEYAEGGSLWDVIESSPHDGRITSSDLRWWIPQCVSAIHWCHLQGFAHRDIKPHNFVLKPDGHIMLIDFGSAAPLLPPRPDGVQFLPKEFCIVPCGTCDYISPEILKAHEEALVALEMSDDDDEGYGSRPDDRQRDPVKSGGNNVGYGRETDWWSLGSMIYEMAYGVAPFFANDIRQTYIRITEHETSLKFDHKIQVPANLINLIKGLLTDQKTRLGRRSVDEVKRQSFFRDINWPNLHTQPAPPDLHLPQFDYTTPLTVPQSRVGEASNNSTDSSRPFAFSALFQSSVTSKSATSPGLSVLHCTPSFGRRSLSRASGSAQKAIASFIGFSWGPPRDAFDDSTRIVPAQPMSEPATLHMTSPLYNGHQGKHSLVTPMRPTKHSPNALSTIRVTRAVSTVRRSAQHRLVSDREAMKQLVDCVGMSARKRVLESGRKPKVLPYLATASNTRPRSGSYSASASQNIRKELRFNDTTQNLNASSGRSGQYITIDGTSETSSDTDVPPSPSPSPRPGSAMSMLSMSRRSGTPTISGSFPLTRAHSEPPWTGTGTWSGLGTGTASTLLTPTARLDFSTPRAVAREPSLREPTPEIEEEELSNRSQTCEARSLQHMDEEAAQSSCSLQEMEERYERLMASISLIKARMEVISMRVKLDDWN